MYPVKNKIRRNYKDILFVYLFGKKENRKYLLDLYNAINDTEYDDPEEIEINTIEEGIYVNIRNDISFIFKGEMNLYEHQSTYNPNISFKGLLYMAVLYKDYVDRIRQSIHSSSLFRIPAPVIIVFYNGDEIKEDEMIIHLSDQYEDGARKKADIEARMININYGHNEKIMAKCKLLYEYSWFVAEMKQEFEKREDRKDLSEALDSVLKRMPEDFIIKDIILKNKGEVIDMFWTEEDAQRDFEYLKEEIQRNSRAKGLAEGRKQGLEQGLEQGKIQGIEQGITESYKTLYSNLISDGYDDKGAIDLMATLYRTSSEEIEKIISR